MIEKPRPWCGHGLHRRCGGFTLMELLVVIVIITVMLLILVPSLTAARRNARLTVCASNLGQIGRAIHTYAVDMEGMLPYGPKAAPTSIADFYVVDGMVTTQLSLLGSGAPVGIGLLLDGYLDHRHEIVFCTDSDQPVDTTRELDRFGRTQSLSGYFYRHGSNTLASLSTPRSTWDDHTRLADLGTNQDGASIQALLMDQNFVVDPPVPIFNIITRTNHARRLVNTLYVDGRVATLPNEDGHYTATIGSGLHTGPDRILRAFERADTP